MASRTDVQDTEGQRARCLFAVAATLLMVAMPVLPATANGDAPEAWRQTDRIVPGEIDGEQSGLFGQALGLQGDTLLVGAPEEGSAGAVYVYEDTEEGWAQVDRLTPSPHASDQTQAFGSTIALDGDTAVIGDIENRGQGAPGVGAFYVFQHDGTSWVQTDEHTPPADGAEDASYFGAEFALEGDTLVASASRVDTEAGEDAGLAYVYELTDGEATLVQTLAADDAGENQFFGSGLSLSGDRLLVGSWAQAAGYVFEKEGSSWTQTAKLTADTDRMGGEAALDGSTAVLLRETGDGAIFVFEEEGGTWSQEAVFLDGGSPREGFISLESISLEGDRFVVGSPFATFHREPAAFVYERVDGEWAQTAEVLRNPPSPLDEYGTDIALDGDTFLVGAPRHNSFESGYAGGAVFAYAPCDPGGVAGVVDDTVVANTPQQGGAQDTLREANCQLTPQAP